MHDFFKALEKDHEEVKGILNQIEETSEGAVKTRENLFLKLKKELVPHMKAEEQHFYPALGENREARQKALESVEEHHVSELLLNELEKLGKDQDQWTAKFSVFKEIVEHHIEEEEDEVWDIAGKTLGDDMLSRLNQTFEDEKMKIKKKVS